MRRLLLIALLSIGTVVPACAQEPCKFFSEKAFDALVKSLLAAKSCKAAVARMHDCAWGSSADTQFAPIVVRKCERTFFDKLSPAAQKRYEDQMQLCAYEYSRQKGTMYMSAAALCQVDVAAHFAADPEAANQPERRASFDCRRAKTLLEKAVCSDVSVGRADIVLSRVYKGLLKSAHSEDKSALEENENQWLQGIPSKCGLSAPPFSKQSLNCVRNEFELRFTALDSCAGPIRDCLQSTEVPANVAQSIASPRASFDCESPSTALEIAICADSHLGQMDIRLAQAYREAKVMMSGDQQGSLSDSERRWLRFVSRTCPLGAVGGIPSVIARSCVRTAFQTRIAQLKTCPHKDPQERVPCLNDFRLSNEQHDSHR